MANSLKRANDAARERLAQTPRAVSVAVAADGRLQIEFSGRWTLLVPANEIEGLEQATREDLSAVEISPSGFGLHFPTVDADVYLPGLLEGHFGSRRYMAAALGGEGGRARTPAKAEASRQNGRLGGRPRKHEAHQ